MELLLPPISIISGFIGLTGLLKLFIILDWAISNPSCLLVGKAIDHVLFHYTHLRSMIPRIFDHVMLELEQPMMDCHVSNLLEYYSFYFPTNIPTSVLWRRQTYPSIYAAQFMPVTLILLLSFPHFIFVKKIQKLL